MKKEPEPLTRDDSWRATVQSTRDWDKGKHLTMERSEQAWLEKQRAEREEEFAPPSFYYDTPSTKYSSEKGNTINQNKAKSQSSSGNIKLGSKMTSMVEKQLSEIRKNIDQEASKISNTSVVFEKDKNTSVVYKGETDNYTTDSANTDSLPPRFSSPGDNIVSQTSGLNTSVPDYNFPLPNFDTQFSNCLIPPINFGVPPPNLNVPPPNFSIPPPNYTLSLGNNTFSGINPTQIPTFANVSYSSALQDNSVPSSTTATTVNSNQIGQQTVKQTEEKVRKKFVPKSDIIDTRLMGSEND
ncbi:uncharacterized protein LOC128556473 [Mercenaria mercenaria]|uniref:uncharacterized protein LOC128556473 n=1 Tax=Mercenaria mercenaria TaxID=6596 RepID=UPI00234F69C6|nr:uncharacterized protein LOC128556473 [Mercenaria mercenaria]